MNKKCLFVSYFIAVGLCIKYPKKYLHLSPDLHECRLIPFSCAEYNKHSRSVLCLGLQVTRPALYPFANKIYNSPYLLFNVYLLFTIISVHKRLKCSHAHDLYGRVIFTYRYLNPSYLSLKMVKPYKTDLF